MKYTFSNTSFSSKNAVDKYIRNIRNTYTVYDPVVADAAAGFYARKIFLSMQA